MIIIIINLVAAHHFQLNDLPSAPYFLSPTMAVCLPPPAQVVLSLVLKIPLPQ